MRSACSRGRGERGTVSTFVVVLTLACLLAAGLALDGGRIVAARVATADIAGNAARAGAQQVVGVRVGEHTLDLARARTAALQTLAAAGATGSVSVSPQSITVTATVSSSMLLLHLVGIDHRVVTATATAEPEVGR